MPNAESFVLGCVSTCQSPMSRAPCPETAFAEYSRGSCYWAGFLMADGYIKTRKGFQLLRLKLAAYDQDHLERFLSFVASSNRIFNETDSKLGCTKAYVEVQNQRMIADLAARFGIVANKTEVACYPEIPAVLASHFIRGLWDGDGGWHYDRQKGRTRPYLTVKSEPLAAALSGQVERALGFPFRFSVNNGTASLRLYSRAEVIAFRDWLYDDCGDFYMPRKRDKAYATDLAPRSKA